VTCRSTTSSGLLLPFRPGGRDRPSARLRFGARLESPA
jgi:hypothetical protein